MGSLCTGYGGLELGLSKVEDVELVFTADVDPDVSTVLSRRRPGIVDLGDITRVRWNGHVGVDILTAGFPCQPVSQAGARAGRGDPRWLWPHVRRAVRHLDPAEVLLENVTGLITAEGGALFGEVLTDLKRHGYGVRWLTIGACHVDMAHHRHRVFLLAERQASRVVRRVPMVPCGSARYLLPTVVARDGSGRGAGSADYWQQRRAAGRHQGIPLEDTVLLLPSPRASDGKNGGPNQRGSKGDLALPSATQPQRFGEFVDAVALQARRYGKPPAPTMTNDRGSVRLSARFAEWLMGVPRGYVTDCLDRVPALRVLGNGVVPAQAARAYELLRR